jgi:hypothetical protein
VKGAFRTDVPAEWHLSMLMALVHAGSAEMRAGRLRPDKAEIALVATVVGAMAGSGATDDASRRGWAAPAEPR